MYQGTLPVEKRGDRRYALEFKDVSFRYPGSDNYALKHLNLKLEIGEKLAVVGMNGSGKTTMIKLKTRAENTANCGARRRSIMKRAMNRLLLSLLTYVIVRNRMDPKGMRK